MLKRFHVPADSNGQINLQFTSIVGQAKLSGLDVIATNEMPFVAPVFLPISNYVINANSTLTFTTKAVDPDQPFQTLTYGFDKSPTNATLDSTTGLFSWMPTTADASSYGITVRATDNANASATKTFQVIVVAPPRFSQITNAPDGTLTLNISAFAGKTYRIQFKNNLEDAIWTPLGSDIVAGSNTISVSDSTIGNAHRFYRVLQLD